MRFFPKLAFRTKLLLLLAIAILFIAIILKLYLYINFLVGNDTVVKLEASNEFLSLEHGQKANISYQASITANPFCKVECSYQFEDLSSSTQAEAANFTIQPGIPFTKYYQIAAPPTGIGNKLFRFSMECFSSRTFLCHTEEHLATRSQLLILEYNYSKPELQLLELFKSRAENLSQQIAQQESALISQEQAILQLNESIQLESSLQQLSSLKGKLFSSRLRIIQLTAKSPEQPFDSLEALESFATNLTQNQAALENLTQETEPLFAMYNSMIANLSRMQKQLVSFKSMNLTRESGEQLNSTIILYNRAIPELEKKSPLAEKLAILNALEKTFSNLNLTLDNISASFGFPPISPPTIKELILAPPQQEPFTLEFPQPEQQCCVFSDCRKCCQDESCSQDSTTFPILILHGHAMSEESSAEYSLEGFNKIQAALEKDGYLNAGTITLYTEPNIPPARLNAFNTPFSFRGSYYFDVFKEPGNYKVVQTKSENIDTHALRLKELIEKVKYRTGKPKVKIIAFSMGGLVARRYLQIFGSNEVDRVILIGTPNHGISGEVAAICPVIGGKLECRDMNADSLFINKLNREQPPGIPVYNIIGTGCRMFSGLGDGAVLEESARLVAAHNFVIEGTCREKFRPLHLDLLNTELYPEVYQRIKNSLV